MNIIKYDSYYLFKSKLGEYHLSLDEYNKLGKSKAIKFVESELLKKQNSFNNKTINFEQARALGFCEYGIKEFCRQLDLDINATYELSELQSKLTRDILSEYPDELFKLFGNSIFDTFGGIIEFVKSIDEKVELNFIFRSKFIPDTALHILATKFAKNVLHNFESQYPNDNRPRKAIQAKLDWIEGKIGNKELNEAYSSAKSASYSAYASWSAAYLSSNSAARSAAYSAAWSAADSAADSAYSAAGLKADSAAYSYELEFQKEETIKILEQLGY